MVSEDVEELKASSVETLARVSALLRTTEIDADLKAGGWTPELAIFLADGMGGCKAKIEAGWLPGVNYDYQWIRLITERIIPPKGRIDQLHRAVEEACDVVNRLGRASARNV
jgi:hypothetical protein